MAYFNVTEVESALSALTTTYAALTDLIPLPNVTHEGRTCHALRIGTGSVASKDAVLFIGGVHAREWGSCEICINFAADLLEAYTQGTGLIYLGKTFTDANIRAIVEDLHVFVFPLVNPDGRHYSQTVDALWRKNRNPVSSGCIGVDINRNYDFLWDFPNFFSPSSSISTFTSTNPCVETYHGPSSCSEAETKNVLWLLDTYPRIRWFVDIHSYSRLVLYPWGDDENQTSNPAMNFSNAAFNALRGERGDTAYKEYLPAGDLAIMRGLATRVSKAIAMVRGQSYKVEQSFDLYPTAGTSDDYIFSRHIVDPNKNKVYSFTIEWGNDFHPQWKEMEKIILEITAGLIEFCQAASSQRDLGISHEAIAAVAEILFGVAGDGGGAVIIGGKIVKIPPRGPAFSILQALTALDSAARIQHASGLEVCNALYRSIEAIAKDARKQAKGKRSTAVK